MQTLEHPMYPALAVAEKITLIDDSVRILSEHCGLVLWVNSMGSAFGYMRHAFFISFHAPGQSETNINAVQFNVSSRDHLYGSSCSQSVRTVTFSQPSNDRKRC